MSAWVFNLRSHQHHLSDSSDDETLDSNNVPLSDDAQLIKDLDLSSRPEHVVYNPNPWSIAKINAASRSSALPKDVPLNRISIQQSRPLVDAFKKQLGSQPQKTALKPGSQSLRMLDSTKAPDIIPARRPTSRSLNNGLSDSPALAHLPFSTATQNPAGQPPLHAFPDPCGPPLPVAPAFSKITGPVPTDSGSARSPIQTYDSHLSLTGPGRDSSASRLINTLLTVPALPNPATRDLVHLPPAKFSSPFLSASLNTVRLPFDSLLRTSLPPSPDPGYEQLNPRDDPKPEQNSTPTTRSFPNIRPLGRNEDHLELAPRFLPASGINVTTRQVSSPGIQPPQWLLSALDSVPTPSCTSDLDTVTEPDRPLSFSADSPSQIPHSPRDSSQRQTSAGRGGHDPSSSPQHSRVMAHQPEWNGRPRVDAYALPDPDPDGSWSTLHVRKNVKSPALATTRAKKRAGIKTSGNFRLPIAPRTRRDENVNGSWTAAGVVATTADGGLKRRVITYLPPPMAPTRTTTASRGAHTASDAPYENCHDENVEEEVERGYDRPGGGGAPRHGLPSPPPSDDVVVLKVDVDEMGKRYPRTRRMMSERKRAAAAVWDMLNLPSCGVVHCDAGGTGNEELPIIEWRP